MRYPEEHLGVKKTWGHHGMAFTIIEVDLFEGMPKDYSPSPLIERCHYCGYVRFETRPVKIQGYSGILTYVPVHGGITYCDEDEAGVVYGFDCGHAGDQERPELKDMEWLGTECFKMGRAIQVAAGFEDRYEASEDEARALVIQEYHEELLKQGIEFELMDNFGAMINVMFGKL